MPSAIIFLKLCPQSHPYTYVVDDDVEEEHIPQYSSYEGEKESINDFILLSFCLVECADAFGFAEVEKEAKKQ